MNKLNPIKPRCLSIFVIGSLSQQRNCSSGSDGQEILPQIHTNNHVSASIIRRRLLHYDDDSDDSNCVWESFPRSTEDSID